MLYRYFFGEARNPYEVSDRAQWSRQAIYWHREEFVSHIFERRKEPDWDVFASYPCEYWPDFMCRPKISLDERARAFEIDYQNSKWGGGEMEMDWHSYFSDGRIKWQQVPFKVPKRATCKFNRYDFDSFICARGYAKGLVITFGALVSATYRGVINPGMGDETPVFEIENLRGERLFTISPAFKFRFGEIKVAGKFKLMGSETAEEIFVEDLRLQVALADLFLNPTTPTLLVGEQVRLPTLEEAKKRAIQLNLIVHKQFRV